MTRQIVLIAAISLLISGVFGLGIWSANSADERTKELMERNLSAHSKCVRLCPSIDVAVVNGNCYCRKEP